MCAKWKNSSLKERVLHGSVKDFICFCLALWHAHFSECSYNLQICSHFVEVFGLEFVILYFSFFLSFSQRQLIAVVSDFVPGIWHEFWNYGIPSNRAIIYPTVRYCCDFTIYCKLWYECFGGSETFTMRRRKSAVQKNFTLLTCKRERFAFAPSTSMISIISVKNFYSNFWCALRIESAKYRVRKKYSINILELITQSL